MPKYIDGTDLLLGYMDEEKFRPLGHSTGCKIIFNSETGERTTKEAATAKWKEKYVKSLSCSLSADGFVYDADDDADGTAPATVGKRGYNTLLALMLACETVKLRWKHREEAEMKVFGGDFVITSLELDGPAGDDEKYSISFENSGAVGEITA